MTLTRAAAKRRYPVDWRSYAAAVRYAQRRRRRAHPHVIITLALSGVCAIVMLSAVQQTGGVITAGISSFVSDATAQLTQFGEGDLEVGGGGGAAPIGSGPIVEGFPEFTTEAALILQGRVPSFARGEDRRVEVTVNGTSLGKQPIDADGRFLMPLELVEGPNEVVTALLAGETPIASSSRTITLDVTKPPLTISSPAPNADDIVGPNVTVAGKAEPFATVTVNGRRVIVQADGSFRDTLSAPAGALELTIVARDRAGNETQTKLAVSVRDPATAAAVTLQVSLDRTRVVPGGTIIATVLATANDEPLEGVLVTLQVGVTQVAIGLTDGSGRARFSFAAPTQEAEDVSVIALGGGAVGRASFSVVR
ncbi:MAG: Ig-like domain-containing protein [Thermoleophilaceae bacterium]